MNLLLAQVASPPTFTPGEFYAVVGVLLLLLAIAIAIKILIKREPPMHREYMARSDCEKQHNEVQTALNRDAFARKEIYRTLSAQGEQISALKNGMDTQTISLTGLKMQIDHTNERIDAIPSRVISLLRETKNLIQ
jgi:hypothetical protein